MTKSDIKEREHRLFEIAESQEGYFTAKQALRAGYYYRLQSHHSERGNWLRIDRGIYRLRNYPNSPHEDLIRWSLWSHNRKDEPRAVFSYQTALSIHEIGDVMPAKIHFTVPRGFRKPIPGGCVVHRTNLPPEDVARGAGFLLTTPLRTLADVVKAGEIEQDHLARCVKDALKRELVSMDDLRGRIRKKHLEKFLAVKP